MMKVAEIVALSSCQSRATHFSLFRVPRLCVDVFELALF